MSENVKEFEINTIISKEACKFKWSIQNFLFCGLRNEEYLTSPEFTTGQSSLTTWRLKLYPNLNKAVAIYLERSSKDCSAHYAYLNVSILGSNGSHHPKNYYHLYTEPDDGYECKHFINRCEWSGVEHILLPQDTLTLMCELTTSRVDDYKPSEFTGFSFKPTSAIEVFARSDSLVFDLQQLYNSKMLSDVILKVGDEEFQAHKIVLCARSSVFNTMLNCEMEEKLTSCVKITDFDPPTVRKMLHYIYCGQVEDLTPEVALQLYSAAEKYNLQDLKDICAEYLSNNINVGNFCDVLILAELHNGERLMEAARSFFRVNTAAIKINKKWLSLSKTNPDLVIAMYEAIV